MWRLLRLENIICWYKTISNQLRMLQCYLIWVFVCEVGLCLSLSEPDSLFAVQSQLCSETETKIFQTQTNISSSNGHSHRINSPLLWGQSNSPCWGASVLTRTGCWRCWTGWRDERGSWSSFTASAADIEPTTERCEWGDTTETHDSIMIQDD